jgi:hypothetical protein
MFLDIDFNGLNMTASLTGALATKIRITDASNTCLSEKHFCGRAALEGTSFCGTQSFEFLLRPLKYSFHTSLIYGSRLIKLLRSQTTLTQYERTRIPPCTLRAEFIFAVTP